MGHHRPTVKTYYHLLTFIRAGEVLSSPGYACALHQSDLECVQHLRKFEWFQKWGWKRLWDWGTPPTFGAVGAGVGEIFLSVDGQGGRGRGVNTTTFGP